VGGWLARGSEMIARSLEKTARLFRQARRFCIWSAL